MRTPLILLVLFTASALAGCAEAPAIRAAVLDEPIPSRFHRLVVTVTDEPGGPALPDALIGGDVLVEGAFSVTDATGRAALDVTPGTTLLFRASRPGHTTEEVVVQTGPAGESSDLVVPLYRETVTLALDGTLGPAGASTHRASDTHVSWDPAPLLWGRDAANVGYQHRLVGVSATLVWTNGVGGAGDLAVGLGVHESQPEVLRDDGGLAQAAPGDHEEIAVVGFEEAYELGWRLGPALHAGPAAGSGYVAPLGIPWRLEVTGHFDGRLDLAPTPGLGAAALVAVAAGAALMARRRG